MATIAEVWLVFLDKSRISLKHIIEVGGMTETIGDFCDAIEADPDGFVDLVRVTDSEGILFLMPFLSIENPALGVGFKRAYSDTYDKKTPFANITLRSANCNKAKGGH